MNAINKKKNLRIALVGQGFAPGYAARLVNSLSPSLLLLPLKTLRELCRWSRDNAPTKPRKPPAPWQPTPPPGFVNMPIYSRLARPRFKFGDVLIWSPRFQEWRKTITLQGNLAFRIDSAIEIQNRQPSEQ